MESHFLPTTLELPPKTKTRLEHLYKDGVLKDPGANIPDILLNEFALDISARYGPIEIAHPIGKGSGQLSLQRSQIEADAEAGLAFVVLKTVIAEDERGGASMEAWKIREPRMTVEKIDGRRTNAQGWTVSWAGRGWEGSLQQYLDFMEEALKIGCQRGMPVIPSCKFNLPRGEGEPFLESEYAHTARLLARYWSNVLPASPLVLEQDFSPTLAGTDAAQSKRLILKWLAESPALIKKFEPDIVLGVKLMNALFEDDFQLEMMELVSREAGAADFLVCFNRLFDPARKYGEKTGIAYGGPDLSDRNLAILRRARTERKPARTLPISATGDITSGRMMIEYALRGATSGQLHTYFQLPWDEYSLKGVSRTRAALHEIYFHPLNGVVAAMCYLRDKHLGGGEKFSFMELGSLGIRACDKVAS